MIASPEPSAIAFDVTDADLARFHDGVAVEARPVGGSAVLRGKVRVEPYPKTLSAGDATLEATAVLDAPAAGARYGSRAKIAIVEAKTEG
jgi:hypothetical protein